jgi:hypothetical protein
MRNWNLTVDDPGAYLLAADIRSGPTDYTNDQIWQLNLTGSEPLALALRTTYGLRARNLLLFPRFVEADTAINDPNAFSGQPTVRRFYPNYLCVICSPFTGIDVQLEYWVPGSHAVAGRARITNSRLSPRLIRFEWAALLSPIEGGQRMAVTEMQAVNVLLGQTSNLHPVVFMTGGPEPSSGPYPALAVDLNLAPGGTRQLTWVHAALDDPEASFELTREIATCNWNAEIARLEVLNDGLIEIETGDRYWDAAFSLSQNAALRFFVGPTDQLPAPSFVLSRRLDQGYSHRGDGSDYNYLWNGQPALEADFLAGLILPAAPDLAKGLLDNFLSTQTQNGFIDWKPGLGGQRGKLLATPLLVNLAWRIYQTTDDHTYLAEVFPKLVDYIHAWFSPEQDRDGDGIPEWSHALHSGFEDLPTFSQWQLWAQGADITKSESPTLCAYLFHEIQTLIKMANILERREPVIALETLADLLKNATEAAWDQESASYHNWDRETHLSPKGETLHVGMGSGDIALDRHFEQPVRIMLQIRACEDISRPVTASIHGSGASGSHRVENISEDRFKWFLGTGNFTSERVYSSIEYIHIDNLKEEDQIILQVVDLATTEHTLLLPLWAGIPDTERATQLVERTIANPEHFWRTFGLPACPRSSIHLEDSPCQNIHIPWNSMIGKGLVKYGFREQAAELVIRLMEAVILNLQKHRTFFTAYHSENGVGMGEQNTVNGLAPVELFLETLGIRVRSQKAVEVQGFNPFPWPVTIRYRGLTIQKEARHTKITFPTGQTEVIDNADPQFVTIEAIQTHRLSENSMEELE